MCKNSLTRPNNTYSTSQKHLPHSQELLVYSKLNCTTKHRNFKQYIICSTIQFTALWTYTKQLEENILHFSAFQNILFPLLTIIMNKHQATLGLVYDIKINCYWQYAYMELITTSTVQNREKSVTFEARQWKGYTKSATCYILIPKNMSWRKDPFRK